MRNLVELRGRTLKNYEVAHELKIKARRDHIRSWNSTVRRADIWRVPREKRFEVPHKRRILLTSLKRAITRHHKRHLVAV